MNNYLDCTEEDRTYFNLGFDYFNSLEVKRQDLHTRYETGFVKDYGFLDIESYANLPRRKRLQLDYGWNAARNQYVSKHIKNFCIELKELEEKYKVKICLSDECETTIIIDGVIFDYYEGDVINE